LEIKAILGKRPLSLNDYKELFDRIKKFDYRIKVNTVVNSENVYESLEDIISYAKPERWKIFQALPIKGQNNGRIEELLINDEDFQLFVERHEKMNELSKVISENNDEMQGSYVMIDPAGRFFDNVDGKHEYSKSILEFGIDETLNQIRTSYEKFTNRNGEYDWGKSQTLPNRITLS
jgi:radical S-adenosyl methionine domain-containing protein 2